MNAETLTLQSALGQDRRFVIPVYQRPYVWDRERQWEPLWSDIESTAKRLVDARIQGHMKNLPVQEADRVAAPHFIGAVVLEQFPTATGAIEVRSVVDGQQRLTTLQLLLRGVLDSLEERDVEKTFAARIRKLISNDKEVVSGDDLYKVWPRPADQADYLLAMAPEQPEPDASSYAEARHFFYDSAKSFLADEDGWESDPYSAESGIGQRASLLQAVLVGLIKLVVIDLEHEDDAQIIFEALNARNTPLSATDLVKNLLFMRAQALNVDPQRLYDQVWSRFDVDDGWWRGAVGVGHAQRARQDWLLGDWLIAELGRAINVGRLYGEFRAWLDTNGVHPEIALQSVSRYADAYEMLNGRMPGASAAELRAFRRIEQLNITVASPLLLWLFVQPADVLPADERELAIRAIESFIVRRMASKWQTRGYGAVFVELLKTAQAAASNPGRAVVDALMSGPTGYQWPEDHDMADSFATGRYYGQGGLTQERLRLILGAADWHLQQDYHKAEPVSVDYDSLQIEHIIPQEWRSYWPVNGLPGAELDALERARDLAVNRIGNLTLVSSRLNPSLSNDPWGAKRDSLRANSSLRLNAFLCENDVWDEQCIDVRSNWLVKWVSMEWPGPSADEWEA